MTYRQSETYSKKIPRKRTTTACFIQGESSDGRLVDVIEKLELQIIKFCQLTRSTRSTILMV